MSTLPPPIPGQPFPPEPMTSTPAAPALSQGQRIINTFIAPSKTFTDIQKNSSWWVPWLISALVALAFAVVVGQKMDFRRLVEQQIEQSPRAQKQMEQVPAAQRETIMNFQATAFKVGFYGSPVILLLASLFIALVLWAIFAFGFGSDIGFGRSLAVVFYAGLPTTIFSILLTASILFSPDPNNINILNNPMPTTPAFFMDPAGNKFLYALVSGIEVFKIWWVVLMGLGFAYAVPNRKPSSGTAITTMFVLYGLLVLAGAALKAATS
jgi:hypothetical protein